MSADLERRLENAFTAYADQVDSAPRPVTPAAPATGAGWWVRWRAPLAGAVAAAAIAVAAGIVQLGGPDDG